MSFQASFSSVIPQAWLNPPRNGCGCNSPDAHRNTHALQSAFRCVLAGALLSTAMATRTQSAPAADFGGRYGSQIEPRYAPAASPDSMLFDPTFHTLWDDYPTDRTDPKKLSISVEPKLSTATVDTDRFRIRVKVGRPGYLAVLEWGTSGSVNLLYPEKTDADSSLVPAGQDVRLPSEDEDFLCDRPGRERMKAILFSSKDGIDALLKLFQRTRTLKGGGYGPDVTESPARGMAFLTADVSFQAVPAGKKPIAGTPIVRVLLHDGGGLTERGPDGRPLEQRLTQAVEDYLSRIGAGHFLVAESSQVKASYTVEGSLSHEARNDKSGGPYTLRLHLQSEGSGHPVLAEWTGTAESLRYLTANLRQDPRVDIEGLVGEMGRRIAGAVAGAQQSESLSAALSSIDRGKRLGAELVRDSGNAPESAGRIDIHAGSRFRIRVRSKDAGSLFLLSTDPASVRALITSEPGGEIRVDPGQPLLFPTDGLVAESDTQAPDRSLIVLVNKSGVHGGILRDPRPDAGGTDTGNSMLHVPPTVNDTSEAPPVLITEGRAAGSSKGDAAVTRILRSISTDPRGSWLSQVLKVRVTQ